ncbi:MAG: serine/threonine protein kinase [Gemmatimonadaceae bacterium]|nr:serine/threonine protein kinase [Chitinophagaceae bacterium]
MATSSFNQYFSGYEILGELGRGNARVLKARNRITGDLVAIKHFSFNTDAETLQRFQRESEIMTSIQHRHIVSIIDVQLNSELPYLVMELIEGGDLRSLIKEQGTLDIEQTTRLARQMTEALEAIHAKNIVHRDIKPENIMFRRLPSGDLHFFLTDFGIAKLREQSNTVTGSSMLTFEYASPEQFTQSRLVSLPTDFYSLGVVIYECITGRVPFEYEEGDLRAHIHRVIADPVTPFPIPSNRFLPTAIQELMKGLLAKSPQNRICNPDQIRKLLDLAAVENSHTVSPAQLRSRQHTAIAPKKIKAKQNYLQPIAVVVLITLMLVGLGFWFTAGGGDSIASFYNNTSEPDTENLSSIRHDTILRPHGKRSVRNMSYPSNDQPTTDFTAVNDETAIPLENGLYFEDFSHSDDSIWERDSDADRDMGIETGKYFIRGRKGGYSYEFTPKFGVDIRRDFSVSVNATWQEGNPETGFGINYCANIEQEVYFVFYITAGGYYQVAEFLNGEWKNIVDWTKSSNIHTGKNLNTLSIVKQGDFIHYYINDQLEKTLPFIPAFGSGFGLRVDGAQTVAFDQFIVKNDQ